MHILIIFQSVNMLTEDEYIAEQLLQELKKIAKENNIEKVKEFVENNNILKEFYDIEYLLSYN